MLYYECNIHLLAITFDSILNVFKDLIDLVEFYKQNDFDSNQCVSQVFIELFDMMIFYLLWVRLL